MRRKRRDGCEETRKGCRFLVNLGAKEREVCEAKLQTRKKRLPHTETYTWRKSVGDRLRPSSFVVYLTKPSVQDLCDKTIMDGGKQDPGSQIDEHSFPREVVSCHPSSSLIIVPVSVGEEAVLMMAGERKERLASCENISSGSDISCLCFSLQAPELGLMPEREVRER